jgi:putative DNA primase/helicase
MTAAILPVPPQLLEALAAQAPAPKTAPPAPSPSGTAHPPTDGDRPRLMVERWLSDRGVAFRRKDHAENKGRTVYVLAACPFDPSHADPDSCIMQEPGGRLSAMCHHNSCKGRGWTEFKSAIGGPEPHHFDPPYPRSTARSHKKTRPPAASSENDDGDGNPPAEATASNGDALPSIQGNQRQLRDITCDALKALLARNEPPTVFQRGGLLSRLRLGAHERSSFIEPLNEASLRGVLARVANWAKVRKTQDGESFVDEPPPLDVVKDLSNLTGWEGVPHLDAIVESPVFSRGGALMTTPGFHPEARIWYQPAVGLEIPKIPDAPTEEDICQARQLLLVDLLGDFPFKDDASMAHALAALLLPFVRPMIEGPTPLHLLDAPVEGTGKTLLAMAVSLISTGRTAESIAEGSCDEEWRKRITALLVEGASFILLDNINRVLDSGALASVLTARTWRDRVLGFTKTACLPNNAVWMASGNNTILSRELIRRTLLCRLDARVDTPWERKQFRHPNLLAWVRENRGRLIGAALTLCWAWIVAGKPKGTQTLGMYESWVEVIGGILDVAGVPGLLANAEEFRGARADKLDEITPFLAAWFEYYGAMRVGVAELYKLATEQQLLDSVLADKAERGQRVALGRQLARLVGRIVSGFCVVSAGQDRSMRQQYRIEPIQTPSTTSQDDPGLCE